MVPGKRVIGGVLTTDAEASEVICRALRVGGGGLEDEARIKSRSPHKIRRPALRQGPSLRGQGMTFSPQGIPSGKRGISLDSAHGERIVVRGSIPLMSGREVIRPFGKIAKIERHSHIGMEPVYICGPHGLRLRTSSVFVDRDGDDVSPSRTEIRKEDVGGDHPPRKGHRWNGRGLAAPCCTRPAQVDRERHWSCRDRGDG
jgi:hypothetical protein